MPDPMEGATVVVRVELRGRLSTLEIQRIVRDAHILIDHGSSTVTPRDSAATRGKRRELKPVRFRLGDAAVAELVAAFVAGTTRQELVDHYGVSLSSVKRLLRSSGARRTGTHGPRR